MVQLLFLSSRRRLERSSDGDTILRGLQGYSLRSNNIVIYIYIYVHASTYYIHISFEVSMIHMIRLQLTASYSVIRELSYLGYASYSIIRELSYLGYASYLIIRELSYLGNLSYLVIRELHRARLISLLTLWISEGLTQNKIYAKGWNSKTHRGFPGKFESSNLIRDNVSRGLGLTYTRLCMLVCSYCVCVIC